MHELIQKSTKAIRVLLIQPPTTNCVKSLLPQVSDSGGRGIGYKPPLGLLYCASTIKKYSMHTVEVIDAIAEQLSFSDVVSCALRFKPHLVGISAWTDFWYPAYLTGKLIKQALPDIHLTYGGPHISIYAQETLGIPFVDSIIVGDGEIPFLFLCNSLADGKVDPSMPGLHYKSQGVKTHDTFYIQKNLDELPIPDRKLLKISNYGSVLGKGKLVTTMITSRGCPHHCTFCKLNFQRTIARSAKNVLSEFDQIYQLGIKEVEIYDDTFTWSTKRLIAICKGLIEARYGITFAVRDRVSSRSVDKDILHLLYRAGCRRIHYGVESGQQKILNRIKKNITTDQAIKAVKLARQAGMEVLTYFMFGNPDETESDMRRTIDFAIELDADISQFSITIPYPGTEMYEEALQTGLIEYDYWKKFARYPTPDFIPEKLIENHVNRKGLLRLRDEAIRRYYFRPKYIFKQVKRVASPLEFMRKAHMGVQLLKSSYLVKR